jgi:hypothetical protein
LAPPRSSAWVDAIGPRYRALVLLLSLWLSAVQIAD